MPRIAASLELLTDECVLRWGWNSGLEPSGGLLAPARNRLKPPIRELRSPLPSNRDTPYWRALGVALGLPFDLSPGVGVGTGAAGAPSAGRTFAAPVSTSSLGAPPMLHDGWLQVAPGRSIQ